jgi:hypothetical protein
MAEVQRETSCFLCYQADETASMVDVDIDQPILKHVAHIKLCRWCATAIAKALKETGELPPLEQCTDDTGSG